MTTAAADLRPLAVRILRVAGLGAFIISVVAVAIGGILGFKELAALWAVASGIALAIAATAFIGTRPSRAGLASGLVACALLLLFPPIGTLTTVAIGLVASQTRTQLREYYGLSRRHA